MKLQAEFKNIIFLFLRAKYFLYIKLINLLIKTPFLNEKIIDKKEKAY